MTVRVSLRNAEQVQPGEDNSVALGVAMGMVAELWAGVSWKRFD
ncbi:hypothetical protein GCM10011396_13420 [Undibacterium terreum]|uniref:Uncharacterized protein n=1 Tax=Undibacterium terreum TaxID=1224302 RepID=A0A916UDD3_9BURK|nr:hypothetical protein GCM10011396_13420 [Undibacterium terreum]